MYSNQTTRQLPQALSDQFKMTARDRTHMFLWSVDIFGTRIAACLCCQVNLISKGLSISITICCKIGSLFAPMTFTAALTGIPKMDNFVKLAINS